MANIWIYPRDLPDGKYYKLTAKDEVHYGLTYHDGEITDPLECYPFEQDSVGGMHFFHESQLKNYRVCGGDIYFIREVTFPADAKIYNKKLCYKCNKFILGERKEFTELDYLTPLEFLESVYKTYLICNSYIYMHYYKDKWLEKAFEKDYAKLISILHTDHNLCVKAIEYGLPLFKHIPEKYKNYELCVKAIELDGENLEHVPEKYKTYDLCVNVINQDIRNLRYVPQTDEFKELCFEEVRKSDLAIQWVPKCFVSYDLHLESVKSNRYTMQFVPWEWRDLTLCKAALEIDPGCVSIRQIPDAILAQIKIES